MSARKNSSSLPLKNPIPGNMRLDLQKIFDSVPGCFLVLAPDIPKFTIISVTDAYLKATKTRRDEILGKGVFEVFPDNPDDSETKAVDFARASFQRVVEHRTTDVMGVRKHDIRRPQSEGGGFEERFWDAVNFPVMGADGQVLYIIHRVEDVTESLQLKKKEAEQKTANLELRDSRRAAVNLMEDAIEAQRQAEQVSEKLRREITERVKADAALRESEERLRFALETIHIGAWDLNLVDHTAYRSLEHDRIFGYEELLPQWTYEMFLDHVIAEDRDMVDRKFQKAIQEQGDWSFECRIGHKDGQIRWIRAAGRHRPDASGAPNLMAGIVQDITERKIAEMKLIEQASMLAIANDAVIGYDAGYHVTFWNKAAETIYGYSAEEAIGQISSALLKPEYSGATRNELMNRVKTEGHNEAESIRTTKDGRKINIESHVVVLRDVQGIITGYVAVDRDITERKRADEALREAQKRTVTILEGIADTYYSLDDQWRFTVVNPAAEKAPFGRPAAELLGKVIWDLYPNLVGTPIQKHYLDAAAKSIMEHYLAQSPLNERWYEVFMQGRMGGVDVYMRDITERKQAEEELLLSEEKFAAAFASNPAAIALTRMEDGCFLEVNDTWMALNGYSREEVIGHSARKLLIWPTAESAAHFVEELRLKGSLHGWEQEFLKKSGEVFVAQLSAQLLTVRGEKVILSTFVDISERKRAEKALSESEERFRTIAETLPALISVSCTEDSTILFTNTAYNEVFGFRKEEIIGRKGPDVYYDQVDRAKMLEKIREQGFVSDYEIKAKGSDGSPIWLLSSVQPIIYDGKPAIIGASIDITDRKLAEEKLRTTFQRFYLILSNINSGILLVSDDDRIEFANQAFCNMFGLKDSPSDLLKLSAKEMLEKIRCSYLDPDEAMPHISEIVRLGQPVKGEDVGIIGGRSLLRDYIPIRLGEKQYGRLWIHVDITERKRAEIALLSTYESLQTQSEELQAVNEELQAQSEELQTQSEELQAQSEELRSVNEELRTLNIDLRETRDYLDKLLNYANAPVIVWNPDMCITRFNRAFEKLTGYSATQVIGRELDMLFPPESREQSLESIGRASRGEYWETVEIPIIREDGDVRFALWNSANILSDDGTLVATIAQGQDITRRRHTEEALRESEERYRNLFNSMTEGFALHEIICNDDGVPIDYRFLNINSAFEKLTGLKKENLIGRTHNEILPNDNPIWVKEYGRVALTGEPTHFEDYSPMLEKHYEVFAYRPLPNKFAVLFMDITERKQAEQRIAKLTRLYKVLSRANEAIVRTDDEGSLFSEVCRILTDEGNFPLVWIGLADGGRVTPIRWCGPASDYLNEIRVEIAGKLGKGPTGTSIRENRAVVNDDFSTNQAALPWRVSAKKYGFCASAAFPLHRQGQVTGALTIYSAEPKTFDAEQVALFESLSSDISYALDTFEHEKRKVVAEEALRETRDYLDKLLNYANAPVIVWDPDMRITLFNKAFEKLTGYTSEEVIGSELSMLFPPERIEQSIKRIAQPSRGEYMETVEIPIRRKDGEVRIALWNSANITASDGVTPVATIAQGQDITERKKAEEKLIETNKELEQFAYVASHDLQEPLRSVNSFTDLLARRYKDQLDERANEYIGFIVSGASRMQQLIQDLLAFSRVGRINIERILIDCNTIVDRISLNIIESKMESGVEITRDNLPVLFANETSLSQLFQNLITNAVKFHREGKPPRVHVSAQKREGEWLFSVKDNGIGINPKYSDKIFVIFQRLHGRDEYPGTGIGLAICKKIVESYGGRIWVESKEGKGSTFYFTFPA